MNSGKIACQWSVLANFTKLITTRRLSYRTDSNWKHRNRTKYTTEGNRTHRYFRCFIKLDAAKLSLSSQFLNCSLGDFGFREYFVSTQPKQWAHGQNKLTVDSRNDKIVIPVFWTRQTCRLSISTLCKQFSYLFQTRFEFRTHSGAKEASLSDIE